MRQPISLEQIRIDSPCEMSWEEMRGDERSRFCDTCNLRVHNLSAMTSDAAEKLVAERTGRICVAYTPIADGTPVTLDYEKRRRRYTWKFALLIGLIGASATAWAQAVLFRTKPIPVAPPRFLGQMTVAGGIGPPQPKPSIMITRPATSTTAERSNPACNDSK
jgi:hypothetical protein